MAIIVYALAFCFRRCKSLQADGQWPPLRQRFLKTPHHCRGEHCSSGARRTADSDLNLRVVVFADTRPVTMKNSILHSRAVSHRCKFPQADGQWPPLRKCNLTTPHPARRRRRPTFPSRGRQGVKTLSLPVIYIASAFQIGALHPRAVHIAFPLRGRCRRSRRMRCHSIPTPQ